MTAVRATTRIEIAILTSAWSAAVPEHEELVRRAAKAAVARARVDGCKLPPRVEISLALADDRLVRTLNRTYRKRDKATNVLSFPTAEPGGPTLRKRRAATAAPDRRPLLLGDVVVAFETTRAEAAAQAKPLDHHLVHLIVHGTLHLLGYDHDRLAEARRMEGLEVLILARLGIADPYGANSHAARRRATSRPGVADRCRAPGSARTTPRIETRAAPVRGRGGK